MERAPVRAPLIKNLNLKVGLLLAGTALLAVAFLAYVLYARGVFEPTQGLTLVADNADGVSVGMPLTTQKMSKKLLMFAVTGSSKLTEMLLPGATSVASLAGVVLKTAGGVSVVKRHA